MHDRLLTTDDQNRAGARLGRDLQALATLIDSLLGDAGNSLIDRLDQPPVDGGRTLLTYSPVRAQA
ncbi:MAG: hypothetical protein AAFV77_13915, partial [Planctomycetota bacterium]